MITPLRGKILVENIPDARQTESGLWLADKTEEVPHRGRIIELGLPYMDNKGKIWDWDIEVGEVVHFKRNWTGQKAQYFVLRREDVFAVEPLRSHTLSNSINLRAVRDMIIIKRVYENRIGASTIVIPKTYGIEENYEDFMGIVICVGSQDKFGISVGDSICYCRNEGLEVKLPSGEIYWALKPRAILARI